MAAAAPLEGIRVIDFGQYLAGPLVALLLAESGAEVIRVDPPGGPRWDHPVNAILNRSKRSVILDLKQPDDLACARELIESADVVIEGFRPGVMARMGLSPQQALERDPTLIWCSLPGFGSDDPRAQLRGWEGIVSSAAGLYPPRLLATRGEPRFSAIPMASTFAAAIAAHSVGAALLSRHRCGLGEHIEVALFDAAFDAIAICGEEPSSLAQIGFDTKQTGILNHAFGEASPYACADGRYIANCGTPPRGLHRFWDANLPADLKSRTDVDGEAEARAALTALFAERDAQQWERVLQEEYAAAVASTKTSAEWLDDDHALASGTVAEVDDPMLGATRQAGQVFKLGSESTGIRFPRRIPGADTDAVRRELVQLRGVPRARPAPGAAHVPVLPLAGIRVVDLTNLLAGPIGGRIMAEYGADVIKVNKAAIGFGDSDPNADDPISFVGHRTSAAGKRTMFVDLKSPDGTEILHALLASADIVHTNMPIDTATRLGIDERTLRARYPNLIYSSTRLHASGGWRGTYRGHEDLAEHVTGLSLRYGGGRPDGMHGIIINDHATGHFAAFGALLAVLARDTSNTGETVETSLSQTATFFQLPYMVAYAEATWDEPQGRQAVGWSTSDRLFKAADGWLYVASPGDSGLESLLRVDGLESAAAIAEQADEAVPVARELERVFAAGMVADWLRVLGAAGIAAHPYCNIADLMADDLVIARGLSITRDHPGLGVGREVGTIPRFASRRHLVSTPAALPGWHTREVLAEFGFEDRIDDLISRRVVATAEEGAASRSGGGSRDTWLEAWAEAGT